MITSELVQLHLIAPNFVEPPPDKASGRFAVALRSVGASKSVYVRPRMITAVAGTKYKTRSGLPVTLVGLHGKDELLVVGPAWAILRLANGDTPKAAPGLDIGAEFDKAMRFVLEEIFWLQRLEILLKIAQSEPTGSATFSDPIPPDLVFSALNNFQENSIWKEMSESLSRYVSEPVLDKAIAEDMLQGMFARMIDECIDQLRDIDVREFSREMIAECLNKYAEFVDQAERIYDVHPVWWREWSPEDKGDHETRLPNYLTATGRNLSKYHFADFLKPDDQQLRRYSMHHRWSKLLQKHSAKIASSEHSHLESVEEVG